MNQFRILIVDDDLMMVELLQAVLEGEGWEISATANTEEALKSIHQLQPDLILLDIMLPPKIDGIELCRRIKSFSSVPIIMLSGRIDLVDKVKCLNLGADDYVTKPFKSQELIARIKAVLRRSNPQRCLQPYFEHEGLKIDHNKKRVTLFDKKLDLTPTEYRLLDELIINSGKTLSHKYLLNTVWGPEYEKENEYLHVYIGRLRNKLEQNPQTPKYIKTEPGMGYLFDVDPCAS